MDIIVTTPKSEMANAAREAADVLAAGGGEYFRRFAFHAAPSRLNAGDRVWYVEDGYLRGFAVVSRIEHRTVGEMCVTTGRNWPQGVYVFMDATSWRWITPVPMRGFQGYRYAQWDRTGCLIRTDDGYQGFKFLGGWRDPRPAVSPVERPEGLRRASPAAATAGATGGGRSTGRPRPSCSSR